MKYLIYPIRSLVLKINFFLKRYQPVIWLIADARSGTTWVADVLNYNKQFRELFEPFHPVFIKDFSFLGIYEYIRPESERADIVRIAQKVLSGNFTHHRVDRSSKKLSYKGLLVKDILVNLYAYHIFKRLDHVNILLLLRNPFAVALSKYGKKSWDWETEPDQFLKQKDLVADYLQPFRSLIEQEAKEGDYITKQVLNWCILNYVPLKQFRPSEITIVFYEEMVMDPYKEVARILSKFNVLKNGEELIIPDSLITDPSVVSEKKEHSYVDSLNVWRTKISDSQYSRGLEILEAFGFAALYDEDSKPDRKVLEQLMRS